MSFSGSFVEFVGDGVAIRLGDELHALSLWEVLADEAVGVFIGPALPTVVRGGEVKLHVAARFNLRVTVELGAVVGGNRKKLSGVAPHERERGAAGLRDGACAELGNVVFPRKSGRCERSNLLG